MVMNYLKFLFPYSLGLTEENYEESCQIISSSSLSEPGNHIMWVRSVNQRCMPHGGQWRRD